jgi:hypothetical protein
VKIYQTERGIWNATATSCDHQDGDGDPQFHFVLSNCILSDNRIPPQGFTGGGDVETRPVAYTYPDASPGVLAHWDDTGYAIPVPPGSPLPITVEARLLYQTVSKDYVEFLRDQAIDNAFANDCITRSGAPPGQPRGQILHDLWTTFDRSPPVEMVLAAGESAFFADGFESGDTSAW